MENWSLLGFTVRDPIALQFHRDRFIALTSDSILVSIPQADSAGAYQNWKAAVFETPELADSAISGDAADVDFDLLGTLAEFALGGDPKVPNPNLLPEILWEPDALQLRFSRPTGLVAEIDYVLQTLDSSLDAWIDVTLPSDAVSVQAIGDESESVLWRLPEVEPASSAYFRIRMSQKETNP